ncbi:DUF177 domain-containing protein [Porphyromonas pogonae]|uniref:YceD family protein n=1 Tax=Porphyromonas pogonae TaxID=867595 RepID=UPI002E7872D1|nr:DUF177 domain-containing protein [Porphyromonas pogonae]
MKHSDKYTLKLKSLSDGVHEFTFDLDDKYFRDLDSQEVSGGNVCVQATVRKSHEIFDMDFAIDGDVITSCDRCLADMEVPIEADEHLVVKMGPEYQEVNEEVIIVPEKEGVIDLSWIFYEYVVLAMPIQRIHEDGMCDQEMIKHYREHMAGDKMPEEKTDPRWSALKSLKKD